MGLLPPIQQPRGPRVLRPPPRRQTKPPPRPARPGQPPGGHPARLPTATTRPTTNTPPGHTGRPQLDVMKGRGLRSSWGSRRMLGVLTFHESREAPMDEYDGRQFGGIDLHRKREGMVQPQARRWG